ncbi:putative spermidine/putrescine transport system permease protein [Nakamurella sp. UYEF19]|uniref:ABC transporter permease n=1 Tax=Nakamurella sp. UYEF19 TaxID=1756392 RepID=UPI0033926B65
MSALDAAIAPVVTDPALATASERQPRKLRAAARRKQTIVRWIVLGLVAIFMILPLAGLIDFSTRLLNGKRTGRSWATVIDLDKLNAAAPDLVEGFKVTIALCLVTAGLTVLLLVPTMTWIRLRVPHVSKLVEFLCLLPLTIPAIVLVVGLGPIYRGIAHLLGTGNIWLTFVYVILAFPYAYRSIDAGLAAIDVKTLSEAARTLGCSFPAVIMRIVLPNIRAAVLGAMFLTIALCLGEYTVAYLLSKNNLSVALFNLGLSASGDPRLTAAVSLILLVFGFLVMFGFSFLGNTRRMKKGK